MTVTCSIPLVIGSYHKKKRHDQTVLDCPHQCGRIIKCTIDLQYLGMTRTICASAGQGLSFDAVEKKRVCDPKNLGWILVTGGVATQQESLSQKIVRDMAAGQESGANKKSTCFCTTNKRKSAEFQGTERLVGMKVAIPPRVPGHALPPMTSHARSCCIARDHKVPPP